jgi:Holliday junction resolvase RusA-like endonuclease
MRARTKRMVIQDIPKSPNGPKGLLRMHWASRSRYNKLWQTYIRAEMNNSHKPCKQKMRVSISQMRKRLLDPDNLHASVKPILDALVHWKLIKDDSAAWIELDCRQVVGKEKITVIEIEPEQMEMA